jgi:hypothetical protein
MTYREALKLTREERRKSADFRDERRLVAHNMSVADREKLGALFHEFASTVGTPVQRTYSTATHYKITTKAGPLEVHYVASWGTIFGRFENAPEAAKLFTSGLWSSPNPYSGKWNCHTSRGDDPNSIFQDWKRQLERVLP